MATQSVCLVAGGCHVDGYAVGFSNGFGHIAATLLNYLLIKDASICSINLNHTQKIVDACQLYKPNILILQMGHFETTLSLFQIANRKKSLMDVEFPYTAVTTFKPLPNTKSKNIVWELKNFFKLVLSIMPGTVSFDKKEMENKLYSFTSIIKNLDNEKVILLSPLPCPDLLTKRRRKSVLEIFQYEAYRLNWLYIDVFSEMQKLYNLKDYYIDSIHLNEKGHAFLGQLVADCVLKDDHRGQPAIRAEFDVVESTRDSQAG